MQSEAARVYINACNREHAECAQELVDALHSNAKIAPLSQRSVPLNDIDICCIAEAIRALDDESALRALNLEENSFGLQGIQAMMDAIEANPCRIRELRLGKNNLKDQAAVVIGHTLSRNGCGLKVLDLSENGITKVGIIPIAAALQHPSCDLVELSFHNNKIESDAAVFLGEAIRVAPKLKHLHLGYNALRDGGATHLAKSLPHAVCLSTLDLTANRIGHEGGVEIARAMMAPKCTIQRLNLRHNQLGSEAIALYADVIAQNTSLIQLFLGFMNPTPEAAADVLRTLRDNRTLLLLDIYGWKLDQQLTLTLIRDIQEFNSSVAAIVTDACDTIAQSIDEGNINREERDMHAVYVGPDDRDAYLATKSLRRFSRAQSRRQSRAGSQAASRTSSRRHSVRRSSRTGSRSSSVVTGDQQQQQQQQFSSREVTRDADQPASRENSRGRSHSARRRETEKETTATRAQSREAEKEKEKEKSERRRRHSSRRDQQTPRSHRSTASRSNPQSARRTTREETEREEIERLLVELHTTPCDPHTARTLEAIVRALQAQIDNLRKEQTKDMRAMDARVEALERRRSGSMPNNNNGAYSNGNSTAYPNNNNNSSANKNATSNYMNGSSSQPQAPPSAQKSYARQPSQAGSSVPYNNGQQPYRSISRMSENYGDRATPMGYPNSEIRDVPPGIGRGNDESGEQHPGEISLQRSASVQNFPPPIEPSPAQDHNPPRRKSVSRY